MENRILNRITKNLKSAQIKPSVHLSSHIMHAITQSHAEQYAEKSRFMFFAYLFKPVPVIVYTGFVLAVVSIFMIQRTNTVTITFTLYKPEAKIVALAGDFNQWHHSDNTMVCNNGYWTTTVKLKPGAYQYSFVVDDNEWMPDPANTHYIESDFGGLNSVVEITKI